ncbi:PAS domain S-box protein [Streptomyces venezuelae]|uniref:histidine kinase n=1 Tax=Streptomyces venezuelae TaxID=54571 RepID=A0A5P2D1P8_STRVZ|nr:PAS domain-containing protein [Streptomyces venezuelae]QES49072.1 PAS domain S-box protein [Streptomyces venezuelae]
MSSRPSRGAARLAAILDALPDALLLVNANGTVVNANSIALEVMESPGTGLVGRGLLDLLPEFDSKLIPGSMRRPGDEDGLRTKPTRMTARRTDGSEFPVEVTSASLDGRDAYREPHHSYTGDELLMLVVRDLSGTVDTEAELARSQRQTEMILRAAAEGVVGTDTDGRVVLVNPAAAQILGYRATDLGNRELHGLIQHSRADGSPFPFEESPLADTLRSGRKHRVRGQVLWNKAGQPVAVDLTTSPVRDGEQLVGAVMTFTDRRPYDALAARHAQLLAVLGDALRGPLEELRGELATLAADDAGQLWPEANQLLHHLAAGYSRMTTLVDNVLGYQRLDSGSEKLAKETVLIDGVVTAGVDAAVELIGPGRAQFAVHAPTIEAEIDPERIAIALAHLIADVAGVDATGKTPAGSGYTDSTIVVAVAQRGEVVRIEVRGPYEGGNPVHEPIVRGIVTAHGGVLQTVEVPGAPGGAYVLELPLGAGAGTVTRPDPEPEAEPDREAGAGPGATAKGPREPRTPGSQSEQGSGRRGRRGVDAFLDEEEPSPAPESGGGALALPSGRRRAAGAVVPSPAEPAGPELAQSPVDPAGLGTGRRRGRDGDGRALPALPPAEAPAGRRRALGPAQPALGPVPGTDFPAGTSAPGSGTSAAGGVAAGASARPGDAPAPGPEASGLVPLPSSGFTVGPAPASAPLPDLTTPAAPAAPAAPTTPPAGPVAAGAATPGGRRGRRVLGSPEAEDSHQAAAENTGPGDHTPAQAHQPTGRRRALPGTGPAPAGGPVPAAGPAAVPVPAPAAGPGTGTGPGAAWPVPAARTAPEDDSAAPVPVPAARRPKDPAQPISVRTLGQGISVDPGAAAGAGPATAPGAEAEATAGTAGGSGRRRRLAEPAPQGRAFAIGAPEAGAAEGPEPLDGPGGAVEVVNRPVPQPVDDELPPEPLDNPRRLLVWPAPDVATTQALSDRGYRPVIVHSREEVDAQIAAFPAALFVDPLTGPITRTALQSLRQAAVAAEVPVLVTAGLGHATREAAYGADPAVLLKALAPRDSEQHPSRVLLIEEKDPIAGALTAALERRGMQVGRAGADTDAVELATRMQPNLVVMDLMQVRRRRAGIVDWLRANGQLNRTPLVVYTTSGIDEAELPRLASGESVLFLAERSTTAEVQGRIVDLLAKIGTN